MRDKSPRGDKSKKQPQLTIKEKREAKREQAETTFIKPRKAR